MLKAVVDSLSSKQKLSQTTYCAKELQLTQLKNSMFSNVSLSPTVTIRLLSHTWSTPWSCQSSPPLKSSAKMHASNGPKSRPTQETFAASLSPVNRTACLGISQLPSLCTQWMQLRLCRAALSISTPIRRCLAWPPTLFRGQEQMGTGEPQIDSSNIHQIIKYRV
jgi:hypothetical protein